MKDSKYLFNNEAIASIAILSVLKECKAMSYSKALLILPLMFHEQSIAALSRSNTELRSSEEFIMKRLQTFGNFNSRYLSLMPIGINSLMLLREMGCIDITKTNIYFKQGNKFNLNTNGLGKRSARVIKAAPKLSTLLANEDESGLYLKFRITL
jgi:hypothetical protein